MKYPNALKLAQQLLDWEFDEANRKPVDYCKAMGWSEKSKATKKAIKKAGTFQPTADDIEALAKIINGVDSEDAITCKEDNAVSDFLCNCVAGHILK